MTDWNSTVFATLCGLFACPTFGESAPLPDVSALSTPLFGGALTTRRMGKPVKSALHGRVLLQLTVHLPLFLLEKGGGLAPAGPTVQRQSAGIASHGASHRSARSVGNCPKDCSATPRNCTTGPKELGSTGSYPRGSPSQKRLKPPCRVRMGLAQGLEESGQREKAHEQRKQLAIRWPHTPEGRHASTPEVLSSLSPKEQIQHATRLWDVRLYDEAYTAYTRLLQQPEQRDEAHLMMGRLLSERKRTQYKKAIQHFQACSRRD